VEERLPWRMPLVSGKEPLLVSAGFSRANLVRPTCVAIASESLDAPDAVATNDITARGGKDLGLKRARLLLMLRSCGGF
jgi:hypothetical protein